MAKNISLLGADYPGVPAVNLPQTGGGTATFYDVSDTTAAAANVEAGKVFYTANGERKVGTLVVKEVKYVDIDITNDVGAQVNSASGGIVNWTNFIGGFVINTNSLVAVFYTYSNMIYVRLKNVDNMTQPTAGNYKVRIMYYA